MNGKKLAWQGTASKLNMHQYSLNVGVAILPFIDEAELLNALSGLENEVTQAERNRNTLGEDMIFVNTNHILAPTLAAVQELPEGIYPVLLNTLLTYM